MLLSISPSNIATMDNNSLNTLNKFEDCLVSHQLSYDQISTFDFENTNINNNLVKLKNNLFTFYEMSSLTCVIR